MITIAEFHICPASQERFTAELFTRGQSQPLATTAFDWPASVISGYEMSSLDYDSQDPAARLERLRAFGGKLFDKLLSGDALKVWQDLKTRSEFLVACLRIAPEAARLEAMPWETLYDGEEFLAAKLMVNLQSPSDIRDQSTRLLEEKQRYLEIAFWVLATGLLAAITLLIYRLEM